MEDEPPPPAGADATSGDKSLGFEEALETLGALVEQLERGELGLEEAIRLYERGTKLRDLCEKRLRAAEMRVERLVNSEGDVAGSEPFDTPAAGGSSRDEL